MQDGTRAYCPTHRCKLDIIDSYGDLTGQDNAANAPEGGITFICPYDNERFSKDRDIYTLRRRFEAIQESKELKSARIIDLDNIYTPVLRVDPKPKDDHFSVQVEIDKTPHGKKLVVYAADRNDIQNKTQIFIDPDHSKLTFDGNDAHPNTIFAKIEATFKDGKKARLED
jgi:hypothetical protein